MKQSQLRHFLQTTSMSFWIAKEQYCSYCEGVYRVRKRDRACQCLLYVFNVAYITISYHNLRLKRPFFDKFWCTDDNTMHLNVARKSFKHQTRFSVFF